MKRAFGLAAGGVRCPKRLLLTNLVGMIGHPDPVIGLFDWFFDGCNSHTHHPCADGRPVRKFPRDIKPVEHDFQARDARSQSDICRKIDAHRNHLWSKLMMRQSWIVWQDGRLLLQPLVFGMELCDLKLLLGELLLQFDDDLRMFLKGLFEVPDLLRLLFDPISLSLATPK